jgi:predicted neutral ceramidase superfamily lipid hydrolase
LDYPIINKNGINETLSTTLKLMAVLAAIWLLNVAFVAVHEGGHSAVAASFGSHIYDIYISPTGLEGSTTHTQLTDKTQSDIVLAAGVVASTIALVIAYLVRLEIAVYVLGLRTVESLLNYTAGSDMLCLLRNVVSEAYLLSIALIVITGLFVGLTVRKRLNKSISARRLARVAQLAGTRPVPSA